MVLKRRSSVRPQAELGKGWKRAGGFPLSNNKLINI